MALFFQNDLQLVWTKTLCPICKQPTCKGSTCYNTEVAQKTPAHKKTIGHSEVGILPIFSTNCIFREQNLWSIEINYPVSKPVLDTLHKIEGVAHINVVGKYKLQIAIGSLFDESVIRQAISSALTELFRVLKELEINNQEINDDNVKILTLPNSQTLDISQLDSDVRQFLLQEFLNVSTSS